jgi:hypothetical protein
VCEPVGEGPEAGASTPHGTSIRTWSGEPKREPRK